MTVHATDTFMRITTFLVVFLALKAVAQLESSNCEEGWAYFRWNGLSSWRNGMCYLAVKSPMSAPEAKQFCRDRVSNLLNLDRIDQFSYRDAQQRTVTTTDFIFDNFKEFWSGMYISDKQRLMWDALGPKYVKRRSFDSRPWNWKSGQPVAELNTCGHVTLGTRTVEPNPELGETTTKFTYNGVAGVDMVPCAKERPFVCEKVPFKKTMSEISICPAGWLGNPYMPFCMRLMNETATHEGAKARCSQLGGYLSIVNDVSFNSFNRSLVEIVARNSGPDAVSDEIPFFQMTFWVQSNEPILDTEINNPCPAMAYNIEFTERQPFDCTTKLPFMCTGPLLKLAQPQMEVSSAYQDQTSLDYFAPWTKFPVFAKFDRTPSENEVIFIHTPTTLLNSSTNYIPWESESVGYTVNSNTYSVNVTLPGPYLQPQRKRRSARNRRISKRQSDDVPFNEIDITQVARTCGYYSFGISTIYPATYVETEPLLVRYSERDLYIYVTDVRIGDWLFETGGEGSGDFGFGITERDVILRRLLDDDTYTDTLGEYIGSALSVFTDSTQTFFPRYYRGLVEDVNFRNKMMRIRLFVSPQNSQNAPSITEQLVIPFLEENLKNRLSDDAFDRRSLRLRSTVACPIRSIYDKEKNSTVTFPITRVGEKAYSWERCYLGKGALASAMCGGGYDDGVSWDSPVYNTGCEAFPVLNQSSSTTDLKILSETTITKDNVNAILTDTTNLTLPALNLTEADIIYTAEILYNYWQFSGTTPIALDDVFDVVDNIIQAEPYSIYSAQKLNNAANRIIRSVDELTNDFKMTRAGTKNIVRSYVASAVRFQTGGTDLVIGLELEASASPVITEDALASVEQPADVVVNNTDTAIYLSEKSIRGAPTRLSFHIYSKTELFAVPQGRFVVNSKVAAARLERNGRPVVDLGDERVTVVFDVIEVTEDAVCGYWDYFANEDAGGWRTDGCTIARNGRKVICECDHLTNFAVLIDLQAHGIPDAHKRVLEIITMVGLIISLIGLGLTIITFLVFKHLRNGRGQQVLVNLSVAMFCSALIFLVGMGRTESRAGCKVVAALLHYFILASFAWMLVEGLLQYLRFVKVLGTYIPKFMMKSMIPAWGIPLLPVIIVLAVDHDLYYGGKGYCWLDTNAMLYAFIIPVALVIFANFIVFMLVLCNICRRRNKGMKTNQSERKMAFLHLQAAVSIFVILGLTWVFGFMAVNEAQLAFHYIFAILNAFQGFFIFLLFTAREKRIRQAWRKFCCKKSQYKATASGTGSDSHPRKTTSDNSTSGTKVTSPSEGRSIEPVNFNNSTFNRD